MNLHLADGGYCDNSGLAALAQWLHNGLSDLADRNPTRLPKEILVIRINAFPAAKQGYIKEHRGTFFQFWAPLLTMNTFRGAAHASSADRELELLSERWGLGGPGNQQRHNRGRVRIEKVDFTFSPSSIDKKKGQPFSWHLRTEEQAEIVEARHLICSVTGHVNMGGSSIGLGRRRSDDTPIDIAAAGAGQHISDRPCRIG